VCHVERTVFPEGNGVHLQKWGYLAGGDLQFGLAITGDLSGIPSSEKFQDLIATL
jgi:hypothetical protein